MLGQAWHHYGFWYLVSLVLALWAIFSIARNNNAGSLSKAIWVVLVLFVPFFGFGAWLLIGPKETK